MAGRPRGAESKLRSDELLRLLASGVSLREAARAARVKPDRVLTLMADPHFRAATYALLEPPVAA